MAKKKKNAKKKSTAKKAKAKTAPKVNRKTTRTKVKAKKAQSKATVKTKKASGKNSARTAVSLPRVHEFELYANKVRKEIPHNQVPNFYCAVEAADVGELTFTVQNKINEGWIPTGGVTMSNNSFVQALIRY